MKIIFFAILVDLVSVIPCLEIFPFTVSIVQFHPWEIFFYLLLKATNIESKFMKDLYHYSIVLVGTVCIADTLIQFRQTSTVKKS